jgi:hypothetical protein
MEQDQQGEQEKRSKCCVGKASGLGACGRLFDDFLFDDLLDDLLDDL